MGYQTTQYGVEPADIKSSIDNGRPVIADLAQLTKGGTPPNEYWYESSVGNVKHAVVVFGYKWPSENDPMWMLVYDTWNEDQLNYITTSYREVKFPTTTEVHYNGTSATTESFVRGSNGTGWKLIGFSFLKINNNDRCPLPLGTNDYPSGVYQDGFDIDFDLPVGNSRIHLGVTPDSSAVELDANGDGTLHIDQDRAFNFRTYRDATPPDGYLASDVVRRVYSVFSANKNIKKWEDDTEVTMVNGIVTHVIDSDSFYLEERDKRLFGIRVHKTSHGLDTGDEVEVVVGSIDTDSSNDERCIEATSVTETDPPTKVITPYGMTNICLGGKDYLPPGGSGTGYGQKGVVNSNSLNNIGLLVRTTGKVTHVDTDWFTLSDGSGAVDSSGNYEGVKVSASGLTLPDVDDFVIATGICSAEKVSGELYPVVIARDSDDLVVVQ